MVDLEKAIRSLSSNDVDYVIVGGVAVKLHASAYITDDLDFCYARTNANLAKLELALSPFEPRPRDFSNELPFVFDSSTVRNATNLTLATSIGDIDLLSEVKGIGVHSRPR